jgi:2-methylcitrate dehydratase
VLLAKFADAIAGHLPARQVERILAASADPARLDRLPIHRFVDLFAL